MANNSNIHTVDEAFFKPLEGLVGASSYARPCPEFPDEDFIRLGVQRVLETSESGRAFLQEHGVRFENAPDYSNYFATLRSQRRCDLVGDVSLAALAVANVQLHDRLAGIPELATYQCYAVDGHWHKAAVHDKRHEDSKMAVGHFYSLNLRTHTLRHLAAGEGLHEHDMSALKRVKPKGLRQGVAKGRRVLVVYDKAGIDFGFWKRCRQECAVYFLSRVKENMVFDWIESRDWDRSDPRNRAVTEDRRVMTREGLLLRIIYYTDPLSGEAFEFLTNETDLPPGVLVELYRRRWEAEKVFDEIKNKLGEKKAWASSLVAKQSQARLIALTHNLLLLYEQDLEKRHGIRNEAEDQRREQRTQAAAKACARVGKPLSTLVSQARRTTQRSVKFIRWIRQSIRDNAAEAGAVSRLQAFYAAL
jgi:hypothetical protein